MKRLDRFYESATEFSPFDTVVSDSIIMLMQRGPLLRLEAPVLFVMSSCDSFCSVPDLQNMEQNMPSRDKRLVYMQVPETRSLVCKPVPKVHGLRENDKRAHVLADLIESSDAKNYRV